MNVREQLSERLWACDWRAMDEFLQGLDAEQLEAAWVEHTRYLRSDWLERSQSLYARLPDQGRHDDFHRGEMIAAATLAETPKDAIEGASWWHSWGWNDDWEFDGVVLERLAARGRRWVGSFVTEVAKGRATGAGHLVRHLLALIVHFDLPHPTGRLYREHWSADLRWCDHPPHGEERQRVHESQREWSLDAAGKRVAQTPTRYLPVIDRMRREPHLHQLVRDTLAAKRGMHDWDPKDKDSVQAALAQLVGEGVFTREELVDDAWGILGRLDTPSAHRAATDLLLRLVDTDELATSFPMLLGCLTSVHGTVTSILLPPALEAAREDDDLLALCEVVFARPEKRQRTDLLRTLTADSALTRWSPATVATCLRLAAEVDDLKLSTGARKALDAMPDHVLGVVPAEAEPDDVEDEVALTGLWRPVDPVEPDAARFVTLDGGQVVADAFNAASRGGLPVDTAVLDVLIRWARSDRPRLDGWLRSWVARFEDSSRWVFTFAAALSAFTWGELTQARRHVMVDRVHHYFSGPDNDVVLRRAAPFPGDDPNDLAYRLPDPIDGFLALLTQESLARAGEVPYLLSSPSRVDGTVTFADLVARVKGYEGIAGGPLDLFQALLRLEPVSPDRLGELDGLALPLWSDGHPRDQDQATSDGVDLIRDWVVAGGFPSVEARFDDDWPRLRSSGWPSVVSRFPQVPTGLVGGFGWVEAHANEVASGHRGYWRQRDKREAVLALPYWSEPFAVDLEPVFSPDADHWVTIGPVLAMSGPAGPGRHHLLVSRLNAKTLEQRLQAVDTSVAFIESGRWNAQAHADVTVATLRGGRLRLARSASAWHQLALAGELRAIWPTILAVLDEGASMARKPVGYPDVLEVARKCLPAVPDQMLPDSVHALAASKGSTRSHLEARALVAAVTA